MTKKLLIASGHPTWEMHIVSFKTVNEKWICFERFVAQAIALSSEVEIYNPHKRGSSYERLSMMSFENNHKIYYMMTALMCVQFNKLKRNVIYVVF